MNSETATHLTEINRRFYARFGEAFSRTRQRPWRGWDRVLHHLPSSPLSVLDLGCGNGRFVAYLASRRTEFRYLGLDNAPHLLADARALAASLDLAQECRFEDFEIAQERLRERLQGESFDLAVLFGVLHHLPGAAARRRTLREVAPFLAPGGILAATVWRLDRSPGFARKVLSWNRYNRRIAGRRPGPIELHELELGDYLLTWGGDLDTPRYCHFPDGREVDDWLRESGLQLLDRFDADGPSGQDNHYLLLTP